MQEEEGSVRSVGGALVARWFFLKLANNYFRKRKNVNKFVFTIQTSHRLKKLILMRHTTKVELFTYLWKVGPFWEDLSKVRLFPFRKAYEKRKGNNLNFPCFVSVFSFLLIPPILEGQESENFVMRLSFHFLPFDITYNVIFGPNITK